jgi:hypothetical protein
MAVVQAIPWIAPEPQLANANGYHLTQRFGAFHIEEGKCELSNGLFLRWCWQPR